MRLSVSALARNPKATVGAMILGAFGVMALLGPWWVGDPLAFVGQPHAPPFGEHLFGTNGQGQDVLAQTVVGARITLVVGFIVGLAVTVIGALIGVCAGYFGGRIDSVLSLLINVFLVIPGLPLAIVIAAYLPAGPGTIALVLILTGWAWGARVLRAQTLSLREEDFVAAAIVSGESHLRIVVVELLPNMISLIASGFIGSTVFAIGAQVGLEFLGLGNPSVVTWGTNLFWASNDSALLTGSWWTFVPTGLCLALIGFGLTLINFAIDDITNPRLGAVTQWKRDVARHGVEAGSYTPVVRSHER